MNKIFALPLLFSLSLFFSCSVNKNYSPTKKYSRATLQEDYRLFQHILEDKHPSVYWYTSKDSMDFYFDNYYKMIGDSMTEQQFAWHILAPMVNKIHCGHTSISLSKSYANWADGKRFPSFPLYVKVWNDTMAVTLNLNRKDSIFKRGTLITSVNGLSNKKLIWSMFDHLPLDGFSDNANYIRMSANFPYYHRNIYGLSSKYRVGYIDSNGVSKTTFLPLYTVPKDSSNKRERVPQEKRPKQPKRNKKLAYRSFEVDSSGKFATLTLNSFTKGNLPVFFRRSFKEMRKKNIPNLVLDIRSNGGGRVGLSTLFTKYISREKFKVADTLSTPSKGLGKYTRYAKGHFLNNIEMAFISRKKADGLYHIRHLENKLYNPKSNSYKGNVYVLINGPTFSASTLFCNAVKGQPGITLLGEEAGGGWYGNNGIIIPDITLPNTKVRFRLPLFRLIQYNHIPVKGSGVMPDIYVGTSYEALLKATDRKMEVVKEIIYRNTPVSPSL